MSKLFTELRSRGVFRAAGFHIAATWLALQIADVVFPAFDIPDSALRFILFGSIAIFPTTIFISWFYEFSGQGIRRENEVQQAGEERRGSGFLSTGTIIVLALALGVSLYTNYEQASAPAAPETMEAISILVSDFKNETGDPIFDNSLEAALAIGMEGAPFISTFGRNNAAQIAEKIKGSTTLDEEVSRLVSMREGIKLVLIGQIKLDGDGYEFTLRAIDPQNGEMVTDAHATADDKMDVLPAVGRLAIQIREGLGDASLDDSVKDASETFTAASLEAARYYTIAQSFSHREQNKEALEYYEKAISEDPNFGRAYSGWALSAAKLGRTEQANELWEKSLTLLDGMTERERYRALGVYYTVGSRNFDKAIEIYELLVTKFPADHIGRNNMAVSYFYNRQFDEALSQGEALVRLYPSNPAYRANFALYAMYAGQFDFAREEARQLIASNENYYLAYIPLAIAALDTGDTAVATAVYERMGAIGQRARSIAETGLADIALLRGDYAAAIQILEQGRKEDIAAENSDAATQKGIYLAQALFHKGDWEAARFILDEAIPTTQNLAHLLPAARLWLAMDGIEQAEEIRTMLASKVQQNSRAVAAIIAGDMAMLRGEYVEAVDFFNKSIGHADSWIARFDLAHAYIAAGYHAEALGELEKCEDRIGETSALFLDDIPTFHYRAPLYYWLAVTKLQMGMDKAAAKDFNRYLALRVDTDSSEMTESARTQLAALTP